MLKEKLQELGITSGLLTNGNTSNYIYIDPPKVPITTGTSTTYVNYDPEKDRLKKELQEARATIRQLQREKFGKIVCYGKITEMEISNDFDQFVDTVFMEKIMNNRRVEMQVSLEDVDPAIINHMQGYLKITFELDDR